MAGARTGTGISGTSTIIYDTTTKTFVDGPDMINTQAVLSLEVQNMVEDQF